MAAKKVNLISCLPLLCALAVIAGLAVVESNTCFFSVDKSTSGTWWFVDPSGDPFFSLGIVAVTYFGDVSQTTGQATYYPTSSAVYGSQTAWADATIGRLQSWNFNTLGAWSDSVVTARGFPYTVVLPFATSDFIPTGCYFPDVWDPDWEVQTNATARNIIIPIRNDPSLVGYFLDNEMFWGQLIGGEYDWRYDGSILDQMLTCHPYLAPGRDYAWKWLRTRYNSNIDLLNAAWGTNYASFKNITTRPSVKTASYSQDCMDFAGVAADKYFSTATAAVKAVDKNHLLLGGKFAGGPSAVVLEKCAQYNDVISIDHYPTAQNPLPSPQYLTQIYNASGKPILIAEFSYRAADSGLPNTLPPTAGYVVPTQTARGQYYHGYTTTLAPLPFMVGFHWFEFTDQPAEGRTPDGENSNYGVVSITDQVYVGLTNNMTATNNALPSIHGNTNVNLVGKCVSQLTCLNDCSGRGCCNTTSGVCVCNSGYSYADCSVDHSKLQVNSFGTRLNTNLWKVMDGWGWDQQTLNSSCMSIVNGQARFSIFPCNVTAVCQGYKFFTGGIMTQSNGYGYGIYTAQMKAPANNGFSAVMELNSDTNPKDSLEFIINTRADSKIWIQGNRDGTWFQVTTAELSSPVGDLSLAFHNYTINYFPNIISFYIDGHHLADTIPTAAGPKRTMGLRFYAKAIDASTPLVSDVVSVRAVSYQLTNSTTAVCV